jgi:CubicO group peptidase (beta-lactamase class C family)
MAVSAFGFAAVAGTWNASAQAPSPSPRAATAAQSSPDVAAVAEATVQKLLTPKGPPGIAIAVEVHGEIVFQKAYGYADVGKKIPVTTDTHFEIGSITKQFTAACILQLAEAGKLSLDDRLGTYVSDYFNGRGITIRQLLEQTSGIPEFLDDDAAVQAVSTQPATYASILDRVSAKPLEFAPGTRWKYSNTNYIVLGRIVEIVSREPYETYVREHIFAPAGMTHSGFIGDEATLSPMARGYEASDRGVTPAPVFRGDWARSAGAIVSTVGDLIAWDEALLAGKIITPAHVLEMRTSAKLVDGTSTHYGYGWVVDHLGNHPYVWHNGGTFGFHAVNATFPDDAEAIVILGNATSFSIDEAATEIFTKTHVDVAAAIATAAPGENPAITARAKEWLHRFETNDIDRAQLTDEMSKALTPALTSDVQQQFAPLGTPKSFVFRGKTMAGTSTIYSYYVTFADIGAAFVVVMGIEDATGKISGYRLTRP